MTEELENVMKNGMCFDLNTYRAILAGKHGPIDNSTRHDVWEMIYFISQYEVKLKYHGEYVEIDDFDSSVEKMCIGYMANGFRDDMFNLILTLDLHVVKCSSLGMSEFSSWVLEQYGKRGLLD